MAESFAELLRRLRSERDLSQQQLADKLFVTNATVSRWENGGRLPDLTLVSRLSRVLEVDVAALVSAMDGTEPQPQAILVDDEKIVLRGSLATLNETLPELQITGFTRSSEALQYARRVRVDVAFVDIELGQSSGLDLCRELTAIHPLVNVIFLTAYPEYALDAWATGACGFLVKPLRPEELLRQMSMLKHPVRGLGPW